MRPAAPGSQAVDRAAGLLVLVLRAESPPSFSRLMAEAGLPRSTTSRMLQALERNELVRRAGGRYLPGPALERMTGDR